MILSFTLIIMKIGLVLDDSLDKPDGVQQYVMTIGSWMISQGHEVRYLAGFTKRTDIVGVYSLSNNLKVQFNHNKLSVPVWAPAGRIKQVLKDEKFDVLHVQLPHNPLMAGKVVRCASPNTAVVGTFHILPYSPMVDYATRLLGKINSKNLQRFDGFCSVSPPAQDFARSSMGIESECIPNAINVSAFMNTKALSEFSSSFNIVFLGRLVHRKGAMQLLKAVSLLTKNIDTKNLRVLICGNGPELPKLRQYVRNNNLDTIVSFEGFIPEDKKASYLASADVAVFPSLGGESFGIVLVEAVASGAGVVLGGDNPGYRSVLETKKVLFRADDPRGLTVLLHDVINDKELFSKINKTQKKLVKKYNVQTVGPQILNMYQTAIEKRMQKIDNKEQ